MSILSQKRNSIQPSSLQGVNSLPNDNDKKRISIMTNSSLVFKQSTEFIDRKNCNICQKDFGTLTDKQKFCNLCGQSICSLCSSKKFQDKRICDLCHLRINQSNSENRKEELLKSCQDRINHLKKNIVEGNQKIGDLENKIQEFNQETVKEISSSTSSLYLLEKQLQNAEKILNEKLEQFKILEEKVLSSQIEEKKIRENLESLIQQNTTIETTLEHNRQLLKTKKEEFDKLNDQRAKLIQSESFVSLRESKNFNQTTFDALDPSNNDKLKLIQSQPTSYQTQKIKHN